MTSAPLHHSTKVRHLKALKHPRLLFALIILVLFFGSAVFGDFLIGVDPANIRLDLRLTPPSLAHPFGCDSLGRDVYSAIIMGSRITLYIAVLTVLLSTLLGVSLGLIAGFWGGMSDVIIMRLVDILMAFPGILLAMSLTSILGPSVHNIILAISITGWTGTARLVRGQVLSLRERDHVLAARSLGAGSIRMLVRHILPFLWTPLLVSSTFSLSGVIIVEASLSFLGLGANSSTPTWGSLLFQGRTVLTEAPFLSIIPGIMIALVVLAFNFLGDSLRDIFDPRE